MILNGSRRLFAVFLLSLALLPVSSLAQDNPPDASADSPAPAATPPQATQPADEAGMTTGEVFVRKLIDGGWTMVFLLLTSIVGVAVAIERALRLKRSGIVPIELADEADRLWKAKDFESLTRNARASNSTLGRIIVSLVRHRHSPAADVSAMAGDIASRDLRRHLQRAYPLLVVATIAPLLGLLGTVIGMIGAFATIEALGELADPAAFGGDISKALITTGAGLGIAVPALAAYHFFKSRTTGLGVELEEVGSELISEWFVLKADTPQDKPTHADAEKRSDEASGTPTKTKPTPEANPDAS